MPRILALLSLAVLSAAAPAARAQAPALPSPLESHEARSPRRAVLLSSLGTAAMFIPVVNLAAIPAGPSLGHFYAGNERQAFIGIAIRGTAMGTLVLGALGAAYNEKSAERVVYGSVAVILASGLYDVATAGESARDHNRRHGFTARALPAIGPNGQVGLALVVRP